MSLQQRASSQAVQLMSPITIKLAVQELLRADLKWQDTDHNNVHECQTDGAKSFHFSTGEKPLKLLSTFILWKKPQNGPWNMTWNILLSCKNTKHERSESYIAFLFFSFFL